MKNIGLFLCIVLSCCHSLFAQSLFSPDGNIKVDFMLNDKAEGALLEGTPKYAVSYNGKTVLLPSRLGFDVLGTAAMNSLFEIVDVRRAEKDDMWKPVYGERNVYPDIYNEMTICLKESLFPHRNLQIVFRAYNEGVAFKYVIPQQKNIAKLLINKELTEFSFPKYTSVWESYGHEGKYAKVAVGEIKPNCELPLTFVTAEGVYGALFEAGNSHYPRAYVQSMHRKQNKIQIALRGEAKLQGGMSTAWRAMTLSEKVTQLIEHNYLILNLNEPCKIADTSWIKPGTAMREIKLTTEASYRLIDFCSRKGIDNILYDARWYGPDKDIKSHPGVPRSELDLQSAIDYAKQKGIGVFLYLDKIAVERYADEVFPLYEKWGVRGIKPGFVDVGTQESQEWLESMVKKAADHHLLVNVHDAYRPTGFSRTYPNLVTQEGIHGNEQQPNSDHDVMLPFTRFTIGAADYTPGYLRIGLQSTWTHRLALPILYYSPAQFLFWREDIDSAHDRPELKLWKHLPTTWDDTKVVDGAIGEYVIIARRKGDTWYVGGITNSNSRQVVLDCSFLMPGKRYNATVYEDDEEKNDVIISQKKLSAKDKLSFKLKESGGFALKITM